VNSRAESNTRIQAVIFDLDGTLIDSLPDIAFAVNAVLHQRGLPVFEADRYAEFVGEGAEHLLCAAFLSRGVALTGVDLAWALDEYRRVYAVRDDQQAQVYPFISNCLESLQAQRIPMAVLSNKRDDFVKRLVQRHFSNIIFREVRGHRPGVPLKPDVTAAYEVALALDVIPKNILFVGDTEVDKATAQRSGMRFLGVTWGFRPTEVNDSWHVQSGLELQEQVLRSYNVSR
jgi:phosphoglycolate phosphatase